MAGSTPIEPDTAVSTADRRSAVVATANGAVENSATVTKGLNVVVTLGGGLTAIVALVSDVLVPLAGLTLLLGGSALIAMVVCSVGLLPASVIDRVKGLSWVQQKGSRSIGTYWGKPIVTALGISTVLSLAAFQITRSAPTGGWLGSQVPAVRDLQSTLGIISAQTAQVVENTEAIKANTDAIKDDTGQIKELIGGLKKETSDDPRKELANLGVPWTAAAFVEALKAGDARTVKLFLDGGMNPTILDRGTSAALYILQPDLPNPIGMLQLLIDSGFDPDTVLVDFGDPPLGNYGGAFATEDAKILVYGDTFQGPALLWVVANRSSLAPSDIDVEVIHFLLDHGADSTITKEYLDHVDPWMNEFPAYQSVRQAVFADQ